MRAFLSIGAVGLVCAARRAFQVPLQTAAPRSSVRAIGETGLRGGAAQLGSGGIVGVFAQKAFAHPIMLPRKGEYIGCGFQAPETPSKERAREPEAAQPRFSRRPAAGWVRKWLACFPELRPGGAGVCCPKSVSSPFADCSAQELGWCRWGDGSSLLRCPAGLGGHCRGLGAECLRTPNTAST